MPGMKLRSLLFVPADSERKFAKANGIGADALILDLEDSVAPLRKTLARDMVKNLLGGPPRDWAFLVRVNPLGRGLTLDDLATVVRPGLDGILIPKVSGTQDLELISNYIDALEIAAGVTPGHVKLLVVATETPAAMIGFASYANLSRRLVAMTWGAEDLGAALGALSNKEATATGRSRIRWRGRNVCLPPVRPASWRSTPCMGISRIRKALPRAAGSHAATDLSGASRSIPIRSRRSMRALRRPKPISRMRAAWLRRSRPNPTPERWASMARCTTCRI
jgi:hypothetical protein